MSNQSGKNQIVAPKLTVPQGGGTVRGVDGNFNTDAFTGSANFSMPIRLPNARAMTPGLILSYSSGGGNGIFGIGFSFSQQSIAIKTNRNIPLYNGDDIFTLNGSELVVSDTDQNIYLERHQSEFPYIEKCKDADGNISWKTISTDNITSLYGSSEISRIADPNNLTHIFEWLIDESIDSHGNKILYNYNKFGTINSYLTAIEYGNYNDENNVEQFAFKVMFDYGQIDTGHLISDGNLVVAENPHAKRLDCIRSYRSGFKITTEYLARNIFIFHNLGVKDLLTLGYSFNYDENKIISSLKEIKVSHYQESGTGNGYTFKSLPAIDFGFSKFDPVQTVSFLPLKKAGIEFNQPLHFIDIEQEGFPGILYRNADTIQYYPANGNGNFDDSLVITNVPTRYSDVKIPIQITSLEGNGMLQLEYESQTESGYYEMNSFDQYNSFIPFTHELISELSYRTETVDLTGDNREDKIIITPDKIHFIQSLGREGFAKTVYKENPQDVEASNFEIDPYVHYGFANIFGDGLNHRVKIENKKLTVWPGLGYGRFDNKIEVQIDQFIINDEHNAIDLRKRLLLADINGSGMTDLVLINKNGINVFYNQNGVSFSDPQTIQFPTGYEYSNFDRVQFADILGDGINALILSKYEIDTRHYYAKLIDSAGNGKAFFLNTINGNMGSQTSIHYKSSVKDYLAAKHDLNPWSTKLPFPAIVVDTIVADDFISNTSITSSYTYRNGYYDPFEHAFVGFGSVEHTDRPKGDPTLAVCITKQWFHLGNGTHEEKIKQEFFKADTNAPGIPFQRFDKNINLENTSEKQEAFYTLAGSLLHSEVYDETKDCPYKVNSSSFIVIKVQNAGSHPYGVYRLYNCESYDMDYELQADDPRVNQSVVLEVDEYNNILRSCSLHYPRRAAKSITELPEQATFHVLAQHSFIKSQDNKAARWLGIDLENKSFEVIGLGKMLPVDNGLYYSFDCVLTQMNNVFNNQIAYSQTSSAGIALRLLSWQKHFYWNKDQTGEWDPADEIPSVLLPHHQAVIVMDDEILKNIYDGKVVIKDLDYAGYYFENNYWWNRSAITQFGNSVSFFLLNNVSNNWVDKSDYKYTESSVEYDAYHLFPVKTHQYVREDFYLTDHAEIDYRVLSPFRMIDVNGNIAEVRFDVLGIVIATAHYAIDKNNGDASLSEFTYKTNNDINQIFNEPFDYIQAAGSYFYYEFAKFDNNDWQPAFALTLMRTVYKSNDPADIQKAIVYNDGFARIIESKNFAGKGEVSFSDDIIEDRWLASGRVLYNAKGNPCKSYLGYFSDTYLHETDWVNAIQDKLPNPTLYFYNSLDRGIEIIDPKGFINKTVFPNAWEVWNYDANDTIIDSPYYKSGDWKNDPNETDAIEKAVVCYNTPSIAIHDNLGRNIRSISINKTLESGADVKTLLQNTSDNCFVQWQSFDIQGRVLQLADARFYDDNKNAQPENKKYNFIHFYPINGDAIKLISTDAGTSDIFKDVLGNTIKIWDALDVEHVHTYDHLQRQRTHQIKTALANKIIARFYYGDDEGAPANTNMFEKAWRMYDAAGKEEISSYTFDGHSISVNRMFAKDYKNEADWNDDNIANESLLEKENFTTSSQYDATGRIITQTLPDDSIQKWQYGILGNCILSTIQTKWMSTPQEIITASQLDANGMLINFKYSNGVTTQHIYDKETLRLVQVNTTKANATTSFQQLRYWHDPTGLITMKDDNIIPASYYNNQQIKPENDFTYDPLYRLVSTGGRALKGLFNDKIFSKSDGTAVENYFETYCYDKGNNLIKLSRIQSGNAFTRNYNIDSNSNRVADFIVGSDEKKLTYDHAGQLQQLAGSSNTLKWNTIQQLASATIIERTDSMNDVEYYVYNAAGLRIRKVTEKMGANATIIITDKCYLGNYNEQTIKTVNTVIETWHRITITGVAKHDCVAEYFSTSNKTDYATGDKPLVRFQHGDIVNSVTIETNLDADIISYEEYSPFGETTFSWSINNLEISTKEYRYSAQEKDSNTGLYYYGYRYYDAVLCRWTKPDPVGNIDGFNLYAFLGNEPIAKIDIMGLLRDGYEADDENGPATRTLSGNQAAGKKRRSSEIENIGKPFSLLKSLAREVLPQLEKVGHYSVKNDGRFYIVPNQFQNDVVTGKGNTVESKTKVSRKFVPYPTLISKLNDNDLNQIREAHQSPVRESFNPGKLSDNAIHLFTIMVNETVRLEANGAKIHEVLNKSNNIQEFHTDYKNLDFYFKGGTKKARINHYRSGNADTSDEEEHQRREKKFSGRKRQRALATKSLFVSGESKIKSKANKKRRTQERS